MSEDRKDDLIGDDNESQDFSAVEKDSDIADSVPAVSSQKKKNMAILVIAGGVFFFIMYSLTSKPEGSNQKGPKTEMQQMQDAGNNKSQVPGANNNVANADGGAVISPSAALPGASQDGVPAMPIMDQKRSNQPIQETLPPPPTLPPVFDVASIYVKEDSMRGGSSVGSAPGQQVFSDRYTRPRERLPEISSGTEDEFALDGLDPEQQKALEAERQKRISVSMFVGGARGGGNQGLSQDEVEDAEDGVVDGFSLKETSAESTAVTIRRDLESVILQGKVIDAVLETAINTDLPGKLRAIVSRDVYSESGRRVVIPKGSRLIGSYATDIKFGQARVYVIWNRVIRPDGVDAIFDNSDDMIAVDSLGRSGVYGDLDNRFFEIFGSSVLLSSLTVAFAVAANEAAGGDEDTTTTTTPAGSVGAGTSTTTGSVVSQGISQGITDIGSDVSDVAEQYLNTTPRITVDQGTRIKIFVNKDVLFPPSYFSSGYLAGGAQILN